ncbi:predicted protein [Botrytis cinerea T4]|uniref:Uncharacterized protein n=1 Tax=Botryotinia fuckeliana (strain T4) TaxID=999810 RepID=G2YPS1_BOTF4|nr:predicted protein [Botrytis cinerea T4]
MAAWVGRSDAWQQGIFTQHWIGRIAQFYFKVTLLSEFQGIYIYASIRSPYRTLEGIQDAQHRTIPVLGVTLRLLLSDFRSHIIFASAGALRRFTSNHLSNQSCIQSH